jgi:hypothetical protein
MRLWSTLLILSTSLATADSSEAKPDSLANPAKPADSPSLTRVWEWISRPVALQLPKRRADDSWWFTIGSSVTTLRTELALEAPSFVPLSPYLFHQFSGRGDVGLFHGGDGVVRYDDGFVGPGWTGTGNPGPNGDAYALISNRSQITRTGRKDDGGVDILQLDYHSYVTHSLTQFGSFQQTTADDEDLSLNPSLQFGWETTLSHGFRVGLQMGWSRQQSQTAAGPSISATVQSILQRTDHTYRYEMSANGITGNPAFPYFSADGWVVYDSALFATVPDYRKSGFRDPLQLSHTRRLATRSFYAVSRGSLDASLHQFPLSVSFSKRVLPPLEIRLSAGPSLNLLQTEIHASSQWWQRLPGQDRLRASSALHQKETHWLAGAQLGLALRYDLAPHWFLEAQAGYQWLPDLDLAAAGIRGTVNASCWTTAFAFGYRF